MCQCRQQLILNRDCRTDMHAGRNDVITALAHVDVVVWMHFGAEFRLVARCEMTSLAFMFELVPGAGLEIRRSENGHRAAPSATDNAAFWMATAMSLFSKPSSELAPAAAHFTRPKRRNELARHRSESH